jgi:putative endonuclease
MPDAKTTGTRGEQLAAEHLLQHGYTILARNWHCPAGELDIIAEHQEYIVFVEVKTRTGAAPEYAFMNITQHKRSRIIAAAHAYLAESGLEDRFWRIDAIGITLGQQGKQIIQHVEDVLDW